MDPQVLKSNSARSQKPTHENKSTNLTETKTKTKTSERVSITPLASPQPSSEKGNIHNSKSLAAPTIKEPSKNKMRAWIARAEQREQRENAHLKSVLNKTKNSKDPTKTEKKSIPARVYLEVCTGVTSITLMAAAFTLFAFSRAPVDKEKLQSADTLVSLLSNITDSCNKFDFMLEETLRENAGISSVTSNCRGLRPMYTPTHSDLKSAKDAVIAPCFEKAWNEDPQVFTTVFILMMPLLVYLCFNFSRIVRSFT